MSREEVITKAWETMLTWIDNYNWDSYHEVFNMIVNFNEEHPEEREIFFCETDDGFSLEDDYIVCNF